MSQPRRNNNDEIIFSDYPDFTQNLTLKEIFQLGRLAEHVGDLFFRE